MDADAITPMYFSHLGVVLISVKPLTTKITENKLHRNFVKLQYFDLEAELLYRTNDLLCWTNYHSQSHIELGKSTFRDES